MAHFILHLITSHLILLHNRHALMQTVHFKGLTAFRTNQNKYDYFIRYKGKNH